MKLQQDPKRVGMGETGIYVRAQDINGSWVSCDMCELTKSSLLEFLKSRGGDNPWAEDCCGIILGHGHLHAVEAIAKADEVMGK